MVVDEDDYALYDEILERMVRSGFLQSIDEYDATPEQDKEYNRVKSGLLQEIEEYKNEGKRYV